MGRTRADITAQRAADLLRSVEELGHPDGPLLDRLVESTEWLQLRAGQRLFSEGDPADGMYILFDGRLRFAIESSPVAQAQFDVEAVAVFGEGALLTGGGRSRTAVVVIDALVARIPPHMFDETLRHSPDVAVEIARRIAMRTVFPTADTRRRDIADARIALVSPSLPAARLEPLRSAATSLLGPGADVVVAASDDDHETVANTVRHSDRVLVVVDANGFCDLSAIADLVRNDIDPLAAPTLELVLLHERSTDAATGTARWLAGRDFAHHLHLRDGSNDDLARFARHVAGRSVGLVLGGGGARGLAHIGVLRALHERSIPVDSVGGSSIGAILGAQLAMGWTWETMLERNERIWHDRRLRWDFTVPTVSLYSGRGSTRVFDEVLGDRQIEDFWLPYLCTTVDLSAFSLSIHRSGPAAQWIRASATVAGLWPPVVDADGHLHIDGGQLNNLPTDQMRDRHAGPIIAVDVFSRQAAMTLEPGASPPVGIRHLLRRRSSQRYPTITDTLNRCALLGSLAQQEVARRYADCYIAPDLSQIGFRRFDRIDEAVDIGYRAALEALDRIDVDIEFDYRPAPMMPDRSEFAQEASP